MAYDILGKPPTMAILCSCSHLNTDPYFADDLKLPRTSLGRSQLSDSTEGLRDERIRYSLLLCY